MTELQAVERTLDKWHHNLQCVELALHFPHIALGLLNFKMGGCALCHKYMSPDRLLCGACPLYRLQGNVSCEAEGSPCREWDDLYLLGLGGDELPASVTGGRGSRGFLLKPTLKMLDLLETLYWEAVEKEERR